MPTHPPCWFWAGLRRFVACSAMLLGLDTVSLQFASQLCYAYVKKIPDLISVAQPDWYGIRTMERCCMCLRSVWNSLRNVVALLRVMFCVTAGSDAVNQTRCSLVVLVGSWLFRPGAKPPDLSTVRGSARHTCCSCESNASAPWGETTCYRTL